MSPREYRNGKARRERLDLSDVRMSFTTLPQVKIASLTPAPHPPPHPRGPTDHRGTVRAKSDHQRPCLSCPSCLISSNPTSVPLQPPPYSPFLPSQHKPVPASPLFTSSPWLPVSLEESLGPSPRPSGPCQHLSLISPRDSSHCEFYAICCTLALLLPRHRTSCSICLEHKPPNRHV